jgi:hypothetical protein
VRRWISGRRSCRSLSVGAYEFLCARSSCSDSNRSHSDVLSGPHGFAAPGPACRELGPGLARLDANTGGGWSRGAELYRACISIRCRLSSSNLWAPASRLASMLSYVGIDPSRTACSVWAPASIAASNSGRVESLVRRSGGVGADGGSPGVFDPDPVLLFMLSRRSVGKLGCGPACGMLPTT